MAVEGPVRETGKQIEGKPDASGREPGVEKIVDVEVVDDVVVHARIGPGGVPDLVSNGIDGERDDDGCHEVPERDVDLSLLTVEHGAPDIDPEEDHVGHEEQVEGPDELGYSRPWVSPMGRVTRAPSIIRFHSQAFTCASRSL